MKATNPILRGFHPDPSIIRVGDDYYIATSTFEWWPGVRIHHSKDLVHWEFLTYPLTRVSQLDMAGVRASRGIWAPCLTYDQGTFFLVYTVVESWRCNMYDTNNYLVTAPDIMGPWSEPVPLNNFGFDPSMFHDDDGRKYMVSVVTDHRVPKKYTGRLVVQEYSMEEKKMVGPTREVYAAKDIFLEGPHIFKKDGWYYLFTADTGTGEGHGQTIQRAKSVFGPYEMYQPPCGIRTEKTEAYSILTSRHNPELPIQKAGHADLVQTQNGDWYMVHLCGRPLRIQDAETGEEIRRYPLGRETAIQKIYWTQEGWPELANHTVLPDSETEVAGLPAHPWPEKPARDEFDSPVLDPEFQSLRVPLDETYLSLRERPGYLRMYGRSGLASCFHQSLVARRWTEFRFDAATSVEFEPTVFKQMAGLILFYDTEDYYYLHISRDEDVGKCLLLLTANRKEYRYPMDPVPLKEGVPVHLKVSVSGTQVRFFYGYSETAMEAVGPVLDASLLSDETCSDGAFTGSMVGICCQDLTGFRLAADFDYFEYRAETP